MTGQSETKHTPGPWGWFGSTRTSMYLATAHSGRRYVMRFKRKGMGEAEPVFQVNDRMVPASDLAIYEVNREATSAKDPSVYRHDIIGFRSADACLIAAAPDLLEAVRELVGLYDAGKAWSPSDHPIVKARAALAKATSPAP